MKTRRQILFSILFILFCTIPSFSEEQKSTEINGIELSSSVFSLLKKSGFSPITQSLVISGENTFPYNVIVNLESNQKDSQENLLLVFFQEDVPKNQKLFKAIISNLKRNKRNYNITVLFSYGEKQLIEKQDTVFGTKVFLDSINSNQEYTAIIFDLFSNTFDIETSASGRSTPPWLIKNISNIYQNLALGENLPRFYLSQIAEFKFIQNRLLEEFFSNEIPTILLKMDGLSKSENFSETAQKICEQVVESYDNTIDKAWERHFNIIKIFGKYRTLTESAIIRIIIPVIFFWIVFIFILIFVNRRLQKQAWSKIKYIWYSVPLIYILLVLSFVLGRLLFANILSLKTNIGSIYGMMIFQILISLLFSLIFFILILKFNTRFEERSIDFLLVICCFFNQSIFILLDISLCPIFITISFLSLIAIISKKNYLHFVLFVLMIFPLFIYGNIIIREADHSQLKNYLFNDRKSLFIIPLVLYPIFLIILRTLTSIRKHGNLKKIIIGSISYFTTVSLFLIILGIVRVNQFASKQKNNYNISVSGSGQWLIQIDYSDKKVFNDIIRTININLDEDCILCDVQISTDYNNPILYTDYDYKTITSTSARFSIPDYPPRQMTFTYGAPNILSKIIVSAVIKSDADDNYKFINKQIIIGDK